MPDASNSPSTWWLSQDWRIEIDRRRPATGSPYVTVHKGLKISIIPASMEAGFVKRDDLPPETLAGGWLSAPLQAKQG